MTHPDDEPRTLAEGVARGDAHAIARAITWIENREPRLEELAELLPAPGPCCRIGITGAGGVGKSSLIARLLPALRGAGESVAVLAVDPTSPRSGGAFLGDRVRMRASADDAGVFIRSFASRAGSGGLAACTAEAADLLASAGFGLVLLETVGVGQLDLEVAAEADHVVLLISPEAGDTIQFLKGGLFEVVDRVIVNKADRPGAEEILRIVAEAFEDGKRVPPMMMVSATTGSGCDELADSLAEVARAERATPDPARGAARLARRIVHSVEGAWLRECWRRAGEKGAADALAREVQGGRLRLSAAVKALAARGIEVRR
ncbi:MAG: methylmalonyl Co-A mutase-associated GTPase MeaB [Planctomycetes bacterium]|nr:methylmalonyl Co-A mutase-associated GTPase MeaB [Planctomycetota bacterium]